ncbi:MAG: TIGR00269 family protein, partial [Nanoarchaeota archaeon]
SIYVMKCHQCNNKSIIKLPNSNVSLCKKHFNIYFEKKIRKTIRVYNMVNKNDTIAVACSGGKDSLSLLYVLNKIFEPTKVRLVALAIDEGIKGYRDPELTYVKKFCKKLKIPLKTYSFKKEFGKTLDEITKKDPQTIPCTYCGVFRRKILNDKAVELKVNKLATGHNLDDEAQSILMNQFRKNIRASAILGPITGVKDDPKFIRRIKPLYFLTEKEVTTFAFINNILDKYVECPNAVRGYRKKVQEMLNDFEKDNPGTKHNIISSFLSTLPKLKESFKESTINECKSCGAPTSKDICQACILLEKVNSLK